MAPEERVVSSLRRLRMFEVKFDGMLLELRFQSRIQVEGTITKVPRALIALEVSLSWVVRRAAFVERVLMVQECTSVQVTSFAKITTMTSLVVTVGFDAFVWFATGLLAWDFCLFPGP